MSQSAPTRLDRRSVLAGLSVSALTLGLGACNQTTASRGPAATPLISTPSYAGMYGPVQDRYPIEAFDTSSVNAVYLRREVDYAGREPPGTIVVDPSDRFLYYVLPGGRAVRYGVGVGKEGFAWSGTATINSKQEWPDWYPPKEMIARRPDIATQLTKLQSGTGMHGGPGNPLGARAMYLWQNGKDTLFRIHGTYEPETIGSNVSSGCIRMVNQDVIDLYNRTPVGTKVVVLGSGAKVS